MTRPALPVDEVRERFIGALGPRPVVVSAPTGSGKSTRLPLWAAQAVDGPVLVIEPRRVACRALGVWLAESAGERIGASIGYRVRFDDQTGPDTRVLFVTPGMALVEFAKHGPAHFGAVIADEFHERGWEADLAVALALDDGSPDAPAVVLCSATLDEATIVDRLGATLIQASGRQFEVSVEYRGDGAPRSDDLDAAVATAVRDALRRDDGDVLVFLPGRGEIEACRQRLTGCAAAVIPVHGGIGPRRLTAVLRGHGPRSVFLATNVAETSLTLPRVTTVIDSGLVRMRIHQAGRSPLTLVPISAASMQQRAGRAGRVAPGHCIRLWSSRFEPAPDTPPEISRVELDDLVLRASGLGVTATRLAQLPWVSEPPAFALGKARERLEDHGALHPDGTLTERGRGLATLPLSLTSGRILVDPPRALAATLCDVVALLEVGRDLFLPARGGADDAVDDPRGDLVRGASNEVYAGLAALAHGRADRHRLHDGALGEARKIAASLRRRFGVPADAPHAEPEVLARHLLRRIPEAAFVPRQSAGRGRKGGRTDVARWGNGVEELTVARYHVAGRSAEEQPPAPRAGLILESRWLGRGRSARGVGRLLLPCAPSDLVDAGLGEAAIGAPKLVTTGRRRAVVAEREIRYAGVTLDRSEQPPQGASLCEALGVLVMRGRVIRGLGADVDDDVHRWDLLSQLGARAAPDDPARFVGERLRTLGVQSLADLQLVEPGDVRPDLETLATEAGLSARDVQRLVADFPRTWAFDGVEYRCRVAMARRVVVLEPTGKSGKSGKLPPVAMLPRFRGFGVEYRKASRQIRLR